MRKIVVREHGNSTSVNLLIHVLEALLGPCLGLNYWRVRKGSTSKCVVVKDEVFGEDFRACVRVGFRGELMSFIKSFEFRTDGSEAVGEIIGGYMMGFIRSVDSYERGVVVLAQLPKHARHQREVSLSQCVDNALVPDPKVLANLQPPDYGVLEIVSAPYERLALIADRLYLTFIYYRSLTIPPGGW